MNISARNQIAGKVIKVTKGAVNAEVSIALPGGGELVAVVTRTSSTSLNLKKGSPVVAIIKASDVLLAVPCGRSDCQCGK